MNETVAIYGLYHEDRCIYVGRSTRPDERWFEHIPRFRKLIRTVPIMRILAWVTAPCAVAEERRTINKLRELGQADFNLYPQQVKKDKCPLNLSIRADVVAAIKKFVADNPRKGRRTVSELTEQLWITYLRSKKVKLPILFKNGGAK